MDSRNLARKHLERRLSPLREAGIVAPPRGWLRAIREALGMTTAQLAKRLGVTQPRIIALEKGEVQDSVTIRSMREAAEAMGCTFVYAVVPTRPLDDMLRDRAARHADLQLRRTNHTMALENQALEAGSLADERERLIAELLAGSPRRLWDEP